MAENNICNICGSNYVYDSANGKWKCPACGAYKPEEISNEETTLLYAASQKLRLTDFDEAEKAFEDIVSKYPCCHMAYWGRLLSRYGIKYEEDFDGRKIPTCYATSIKSFMFDPDYIKACELCDNKTKEFYVKQAEYIERVRKDWVNKASKEKPYDIFICYKESDFENNIERTKDSVEAQELYFYLKDQGYRVFYSRESLRDKVGEKYEPYIFSALSSAKVMIVYGSNPNYIKSTWPKNEWMRYLKRMNAGDKKKGSLIIARNGFSPNELPGVLSNIQCIDASQKTFYIDIDRTIKALLNDGKKTKASKNDKKTRRFMAIGSFVGIVAISIILLVFVVIPSQKESDYYTTNQMLKVDSSESELGFSSQKESDYYTANQMLKDGDYESALEIYNGLKDYLDSYDKMITCLEKVKSIAHNYYTGNGVEQDYSEYVQWLKIAADYNDAESQYNLGVCYDEGIGVIESKITAVNWYTLAAEQGYVLAEEKMGCCYEIGDGVGCDYTEAAKWYTLAAEHGSISSQCKLGELYEEGNGVEQSYSEAVKWYKISANQGYGYAQFKMGWCYYNGYGVNQDYNESVKWYQLGADSGDMSAQSNLSYCYATGIGTIQSYSEALKWANLAAEQGDSKGQLLVGEYYYFGNGVAQDYTEAIKWFKLSSDQGQNEAICLLGMCYYEGNGVIQDYVEAVKWFQVGAKNGDSSSQAMLVLCNT